MFFACFSFSAYWETPKNRIKKKSQIQNSANLNNYPLILFQDILHIRQNIIRNYSALPRKGIDAYNEIITNTALISTGVERLVEYSMARSHKSTIIRYF